MRAREAIKLGTGNRILDYHSRNTKTSRCSLEVLGSNSTNRVCCARNEVLKL